MNQPRPIRRRWLRVSLRGLMVLVLVAGGGIGWLSYTIRTQRAAIRVVRAAGGTIFDEVEVGSLRADAPWTMRAGRTLRSWAEPVVGHDLAFPPVGVYLNYGPADEAVVASVTRFADLEFLGLNNATVIGEGWRQLPRLTRLKELRVIKAGLDDAALVAIGQIRSLETLILMGGWATDTGYAALGDLRKLRDLRILDSQGLTRSGAERLFAGLPALRSLTLNCASSEIIPPVLASLPRSHPDLEDLELSCVFLAPADAAALARLPRLRSLACSNVVLGDAGLAELGLLPRLAELKLEAAGITDAGLPYLARLPALQSLTLGGPEITDAGIAALEHLTITELNLTDLPLLTKAGLIPLGRMTGLQTLRLGTSTVNPAGVAALQRALPRVKVVLESVPVPLPLISPPSPTPASTP